MTPSLRPPHLPACSRLTPTEAAALLDSARGLQRAQAAGQLQPLLRGKKLALICHDDRQPEALLLRRAARELGMHVALVPAGLDEHSSAQDIEHAARLLGRLYDAVECQGMSSTLVQRLADAADIAVFDALASATHPTAALARQLDAPQPADNRCCVVQAVLLGTVT